jgi:FKBP-type peptidyl-prolyl cis-trans isomerase 2
MAKAQQGDRVRVHYTGTLDDGSQFDSSRGGEPLEFTVGTGEVIAGFDAAVQGLAPGGDVEVRIEAAEAYGERRDELVLSVRRTDLPSTFEPEIGDEIEMAHPSGHRFPGFIVDVDEESVEIDANHPLAGRALTFAIELVEIV